MGQYSWCQFPCLMKQETISSRMQRAVGFHNQGQLDQAERIYEAILKEDPEQFYALNFLGCIKRIKRDYNEGISLLVKVYFEINRIEIGDIETCDDKCLLTILKKLKMATRFGGLRFLNYQSSVNSSLYKKLLPFSNSGSEASFFILREFKNKIPPSSISLQLLDSDGF